jgi:endonuclease-3
LPILTGMNSVTKARWIKTRLSARYGEISLQRTDPLETLIKTILSQNTSDGNRDRAYRSLHRRFRSLTAIKDATVEEIAEAIRVGGLHRQKALRIKQVLQRVERETGPLDLSYLGELSLDEAMAWLLASPGVGKKTAGIVALFSFGKPYFPVDTHIRRVLTRLGLVEPQEDPHDRMNAMLPKDPQFMATLHLCLIQLGREVCRPRRPDCLHCPLNDGCKWAKTELP